jgi:hypothetical protein
LAEAGINQQILPSTADEEAPKVVDNQTVVVQPLSVRLPVGTLNALEEPAGFSPDPRIPQRYQLYGAHRDLVMINHFRLPWEPGHSIIACTMEFR